MYNVQCKHVFSFNAPPFYFPPYYSQPHLFLHINRNFDEFASNRMMHYITTWIFYAVFPLFIESEFVALKIQCSPLKNWHLLFSHSIFVYSKSNKRHWHQFQIKYSFAYSFRVSQYEFASEKTGKMTQNIEMMLIEPFTLLTYIWIFSAFFFSAVRHPIIGKWTTNIHALESGPKDSCIWQIEFMVRITRNWKKKTLNDLLFQVYDAKHVTTAGDARSVGTKERFKIA